MSLPTRERGLKYNRIAGQAVVVMVAPYTGAWIEICQALRPAYE